MPLAEAIHMTLQYSNAVLVALLPHFSEFAAKLDLPVPQPITTNHVARFVPGKFAGDVGGYLTLTNGYKFWFGRGYVDSFQSSRDYGTLQQPERIPDFYGKLQLNEGQAIDLARDALKRVGYRAKLPFVEKNPREVRGPYEHDGNTIPHYEIIWVDESSGRHYVDIDIDGEKGIVTRLFAAGTNLWRIAPKLDVMPELESEYRKQMQPEAKSAVRRDPPPEKLDSRKMELIRQRFGLEPPRTPEPTNTPALTNPAETNTVPAH